MKRILLAVILVLGAMTVFAGDDTGGTTSDYKLVGRWSWLDVSLNGQEINTGDNATSYLLTLNEDGSMKIKADCRQGSGTWSTMGNTLTLSINSSTSTNCEAGSYGAKMMELLETSVFTYKITSLTQLELTFAKGLGKANFRKTNDTM